MTLDAYAPAAGSTATAAFNDATYVSMNMTSTPDNTGYTAMTGCQFSFVGGKEYSGTIVLGATVGAANLTVTANIS